MLRVTIYNNESTTDFLLVVEGKLIKPWTEELRKSWENCRARSSQTQSIMVDLTAVSFVDETGEKLLAEMHRHSTKFIAPGIMLHSLVEKISKSGRQRTFGKSSKF